jgi:hypothetical protein
MSFALTETGTFNLPVTRAVRAARLGFAPMYFKQSNATFFRPRRRKDDP